MTAVKQHRGWLSRLFSCCKPNRVLDEDAGHIAAQPTLSHKHSATQKTVQSLVVDLDVISPHAMAPQQKTPVPLLDLSPLQSAAAHFSVQTQPMETPGAVFYTARSRPSSLHGTPRDQLETIQDSEEATAGVLDLIGTDRGTVDKQDNHSSSDSDAASVAPTGAPQQNAAQGENVGNQGECEHEGSIPDGSVVIHDGASEGALSVDDIQCY